MCIDLIIIRDILIMYDYDVRLKSRSNKISVYTIYTYLIYSLNKYIYMYIGLFRIYDSVLRKYNESFTDFYQLLYCIYIITQPMLTSHYSHITGIWFFRILWLLLFGIKIIKKPFKRFQLRSKGEDPSRKTRTITRIC